MRECDVVVLGAGAAGLMAAIFAGRRGRRVLVLDHADRPGKKILISGGGRANFTNLGCTADNFLSENPHFARSALSRFTPADMVAMVEQHGIAYHEKTLGQLFCDRSARDLVGLLEAECGAAGVRIECGTRVIAVRGAPVRGGFAVETAHGELRAAAVVVATGGLSIPKIGATGLGYDLARQFGLRVAPTRPGLVPLTLAGQELAGWCDLAGVSAEAVVRVAASRAAGAAPSFREKVLITHRGLSGPAILQVSSYWCAGQQVEMDLAPGREVFAELKTPRARRDPAAAVAALRAVLPGRWAERFGERWSGVKDLSNHAIAQAEAEVHGWRLSPSGSEGFSKAEVTVGGVDTAELDPRTMAARRVPGLYFVGELVDVTGWLGGYNFQWAWAWASGAAAGEVA